MHNRAKPQNGGNHISEDSGGGGGGEGFSLNPL